MEKCSTCVYYKEFLFARPICTRVSNVTLKTQKNVPFKLYEGYKICKGYFYEPNSDVSSSSETMNCFKKST